MAFKPALCRADQSSSFGHSRPSPQTSVTTTLNCTLHHDPPHANNPTIRHTKALDKALDTWYNTGVGVKSVIVYHLHTSINTTHRSTMISIKMKPNDSMERAMTKLKNIVIKEGLYKELKDRRYYAKPSRKKKLKREEAARQRVKDLHKDIRAALRDEENFLM